MTLILEAEFSKMTLILVRMILILARMTLILSTIFQRMTLIKIIMRVILKSGHRMTLILSDGRHTE